MHHHPFTGAVTIRRLSFRRSWISPGALCPDPSHAGDLAVITESVHFGTAEPTSSASVAPFRYAPLWGLSPFRGHQVLSGYPRARFAVAQSSALSGGIESKEGISPSSAQRSVTSPIRGMTLHRAERSGGSFVPHPGQQKHRGLAPPEQQRGWQAPHGPCIIAFEPLNGSPALCIVGILISCSKIICS